MRSDVWTGVGFIARYFLVKKKDRDVNMHVYAVCLQVPTFVLVLGCIFERNSNVLYPELF